MLSLNSISVIRVKKVIALFIFLCVFLGVYAQEEVVVSDSVAVSSEAEAIADTSTSESIASTSSLPRLELDLSRAIEIALDSNPTIMVADKEIELKKVADSEAWQSLLPTLQLTASLDYTILAAEMNLGGQKFKMGEDGTNTVAAALSLNLPVFAPAVYQTMKLTKQDILLAQEQARGSRLDLINQVTKAYYTALLAKDSYEVMQQSYATAKENYEIVNSKYQVGSVSEYDKLSAEVQMRSMSSSLVSSETALTLALLQLRVLMGVTENVDIVIADNLREYENVLTLEDPGSTILELSNNSSLREIDYNAAMLDRNRKILKTNFMPQISFTIQGQYQSLYNRNWRLWDYNYSPSASFSIGITMPIFQASNFTKLKTNKLQRAELEDTRANTVNNLTMAMESYLRNMASSIAQVESNHVAVEQAQKAVTISEKRYEIGGGTILELNQSETALTQAELTYNQSIYDYLSNRADLDYTLGRETYLK